MSTIRHYVRTIGPDGGVEVCDGPAIGLDLASMLEPGLPPWSVALQIFAGLCEILDIADQDRQIHGDLGLRDVFVDDTGAVSVEGIGVSRARTSAPEGAPRGHATDLYGLGRILFALLCDRPLPALPTHDPAAHDDAVIDAVLLVDLAGLPEEMQGDVQWYLAKLLAHDPADRPSALEAWRTFVAFADALDGPDFVGWCSEAVDGGGARREATGPRAAPAPAPEEEQLGGPVKRAGPLSGGMSFAPAGGAARGGATAFWTRDEMKAALEQGDDDPDDDDDEPFRPAVGGGSATAFWSADELAAMQRGSAEAPRPKRSSKRSQTLMMALPRPGDADPVDPVPASPPPPVAAGPVASGPVAAQPARPAPAAAAPVASGPVAAAPAAPAPRRRLLVVAAVAAGGLFLLTCLGLGGIGAWLVLGAGDAPSPEAALPAAAPTVLPADPAPTDTDEPRGDDGAEPDAPEEAAAAPAPPPAPKPAAPAPARSAPAKPARAAEAPAPAPTPAPAAGPARVRLSSSGRGSVSCAGNQQAFDGAPITLVVEAYQLPATCLVELEGQRGVFQVYGSGSVRCDASASGVSCDPSAVK